MAHPKISAWRPYAITQSRPCGLFFGLGPLLASVFSRSYCCRLLARYRRLSVCLLRNVLWLSDRSDSKMSQLVNRKWHHYRNTILRLSTPYTNYIAQTPSISIFTFYLAFMITWPFCLIAMYGEYSYRGDHWLMRRIHSTIGYVSNSWASCSPMQFDRRSLLSK